MTSTLPVSTSVRAAGAHARASDPKTSTPATEWTEESRSLAPSRSVAKTAGMGHPNARSPQHSSCPPNPRPAPLTPELRSIELIVGERINLEDVDEQERDTLAKIQEILYQTEEGFEVPDGEEGELLDDETF